MLAFSAFGYEKIINQHQMFNYFVDIIYLFLLNKECGTFGGANKNK